MIYDQPTHAFLSMARTEFIANFGPSHLTHQHLCKYGVGVRVGGMCWYVLGYHDVVFAGEMAGCDGVEWYCVGVEHRSSCTIDPLMT